MPDSVRNWSLAFVLAAGSALPALAQAAEPEQAVPDRLWSISLTGGLSASDGGGNQKSAQIGLTRNLGAGFAGLSLARLDAPAEAGQRGALASKADQLTLSGGYGFGALSLDAYASYGWRKFNSAVITAGNGQSVTVAAKGKNLSLGAGLSYELPLGEHAAIAPFISLDYGRVDSIRAALIPVVGLVALAEQNSGITGTAGLSLTHRLGPDDANSIGASGAFVTSSNAAASSFGARTRAARTVRRLDGISGADSWAEFGGSASVRLNQAIALDLSLTRTAGSAGPESTSVSAGLRFGF